MLYDNHLSSSPAYRCLFLSVAAVFTIERRLHMTSMYHWILVESHKAVGLLIISEVTAPVLYSYMDVVRPKEPECTPVLLRSFRRVLLVVSATCSRHHFISAFCAPNTVHQVLGRKQSLEAEG
jgi:hypothetical protein